MIPVGMQPFQHDDFSNVDWLRVLGRKKGKKSFSSANIHDNNAVCTASQTFINGNDLILPIPFVTTACSGATSILDLSVAMWLPIVQEW
jgi:hypothetical protein